MEHGQLMHHEVQKLLVKLLSFMFRKTTFSKNSPNIFTSCVNKQCGSGMIYSAGCDYSNHSRSIIRAAAILTKFSLYNKFSAKADEFFFNCAVFEIKMINSVLPGKYFGSGCDRGYHRKSHATFVFLTLSVLSANLSSFLLFTRMRFSFFLILLPYRFYCIYLCRVQCRA